MARDFHAWRDPDEQLRWLDVDAGTGALSASILATADPREIVGIDASREYVDAAVSGLVLNFLADTRSDT